VVVAPDLGQTAAAVESQAAELAARGIVGVAIDYRGWGKSGAFIYLADQVRWDDRLRFSQHTAKVRLRRKRIIPAAQVIDIRNAITYIQGEPGVDAARIGVWGTGLSGAHVAWIAANDARLKAGVTVSAVTAGQGVEAKSFAPAATQQSAMVTLARTGQAPPTAAAAAAMNDDEAKLALAEYQPFRSIDQVPKETALLHLERTADVERLAAEFLAKALMK
jgi:dienelactone hydrolase